MVQFDQAIISFGHATAPVGHYTVQGVHVSVTVDQVTISFGHVTSRLATSPSLLLRHLPYAMSPLRFQVTVPDTDIIPVDHDTIPVAMSLSVARSLSQLVTSPSKLSRTSSNLAKSCPIWSRYRPCLLGHSLS